VQLNPSVNAFQRKFVNEVRRCEEMERKLRESSVLYFSHTSIGVRDGGQGGTCPPPPKIRGKYFSDIYYIKFGHFPGKNHVKFANFVNFSEKYYKNSGILIFGEKYFSDIYYVKFGHFAGKNYVKFANFVNFSEKYYKNSGILIPEFL